MLKQGIFVCLLLFAVAHAASVTKTTCTGANVPVGASRNWTNPNNLCTASDANVSNTPAAQSSRLRGSNFGFTTSDVPAGSTINGIVVSAVKSTSQTSFPAGTKILTPSGPRNIEDLKDGDLLLSFDGWTLAVAKKTGAIIHNVSFYYALKTKYSEVNVSENHPFWNGSDFVKVQDLQAGDRLIINRNGHFWVDYVANKAVVNRTVQVYNLQVSSPNTYFANGFAVHNKGTCTLPTFDETEVYLVLANGSLGTLNYASESSDPPSGQLCLQEGGIDCWAWNGQGATYYYDSAQPTTDTWGQTLNSGGGGAGDITNSSFGVSFRGKASTSIGCVNQLFIQGVSMTVYYTPGGPTTSINFTAPTTNASNITQNWIAANATFANSNNASIRLYNASGSLISSYNSSTSPIYTNFTGLAIGLYYLNATATNNTTASTETRAINISATSISFVGATTAIGSYAQDWIYAAVTATWASNTTIWLYNGTTLINSTNATGNTSSVNYTGLGAGFYKINATSRNPVSTASTETRNITLRQYCYQEQANASTTCGGLGTGNYAFENNYVYMNYTRPANALNTSLWQVQHSTLAAYNVSIPSDCWNSTLRFRMYSNTVQLIEFGSGESYGSCYNGTAWKNITTDSIVNTGGSGTGTVASPTTVYDGNYSSFATFYSSVGTWQINGDASLKIGGRLYEEAMFWDMNTTLPAADSCTCPASPANYIIQLADLCNFTTSCNMGANTITFNGSTGYATFNNASLNPLTFTASKICWKGTNSSYLWFKTSTWFNGTMSGC